METVGRDFAGARTPVGSVVEFTARGLRIRAKVARLQRRNAIVAAGENGRWRVPYNAMTVVERCGTQVRDLAAADRLMQELLQRHKASDGLDHEWQARFDLAPSRAGICNYRHKLICLSVNYCLRAPEEELRDTILHEIAHALVGPGHNHDLLWQVTARRIGCTAQRCSDVEHTAGKWIGRCNCSRPILRKRLSTRVRNEGRCPVCRQRIEWKKNTEGIGAE